MNTSIKSTIKNDIFCNSHATGIIKKPTESAKFLLFIRCGKRKPKINFDLLINSKEFDICYSFYQAPEFETDGSNIYITYGGLSKYHAFKSLWDSDEIFKKYSAYWLLDNDIEFETNNILQLFYEGLNEHIHLWQPSLTHTSYSRWSHLYKINGRTGLRLTNFVEVMAPIFSNDGINECIYTFDESISTWGLDFAWSSKLASNKMGISDTFSITHAEVPDTKNGDYYKYLKSLSINPYIELLKIKIKYKAIFFHPRNKSHPYLIKLINAIRETDRINSDIFNFEINNNPEKFFTSYFFLNHHSIIILAENCVELDKKTRCYVDGMALKQQLNLSGARVSFDFSGVADHVFNRCRDLNLNIGVIGGTADEATQFKQIIEHKYRGLTIFATDGFKTMEQLEKVSRHYVENNKIKVLIFGVGTPLQENILLKLAQSPDFHGIIGFTCGGFISQTANSIDGKYYPKFINDFNLRWLWRIFTAKHVLKRLFTTYARSFLAIKRATQNE